MRRKRRNFWPFIAITIGVIIILSLILPTEFWWFFFAALLIAIGCWFLRCCC